MIRDILSLDGIVEHEPFHNNDLGVFEITLDAQGNTDKIVRRLPYGDMTEVSVRDKNGRLNQSFYAQLHDAQGPYLKKL